MSPERDTIVIGAGPAGIGGASLLAERGARVLVVDEAPAPGGQIWRGIENASAARKAILGPDYARGATEVARLRQSGAALALNTSVWRVENDGTVWLRDENGLRRETARHLLIATGAMERPVPVPGWTLPGVMTIGGLQILLKRDGLLPEGPLALVGSGPLFYLYATQCLAAGKRDLVLLDTASAGAWPRAVAHLPAALTGAGPSYLLKGAGLLWRLRRSGTHRYQGVSDVSISSGADCLRLRFRAGGKMHSLDVTRIGLHQGVIPETYLPRSLGCRMIWSPGAAALQPFRDAAMGSSLANIHIAGDAGGIGGAMAALCEGRIAAMSILERLGHVVDPLILLAARRERRAHLRARPLIERLYQPPTAIQLPTDEVIACRCEEVRCGAIRESLADGSAGPNQTKAFLRCGMGPCQGRICGPTLDALAREAGQEGGGGLSIRSPLRPLTLGEIADLGA